MTGKENLLEDYKNQLLKSLGHLEYSFQKVSQLSTDATILDDEQLESWEGFMARFARTCDIYLSKYIRTLVQIEEPAYRGSFRDYLNQAEKLGFIANAHTWLALKELRNLQAHEYAEEKLGAFFTIALKEAHHLLDLKNQL